MPHCSNQSLYVFPCLLVPSQIKRLISSAKEFDSMLSKEVPLSVFFDARELEDKHPGLLDGAAVVVSNTIAQREHLTALGYSYWPDSLKMRAL